MLKNATKNRNREKSRRRTGEFHELGIKNANIYNVRPESLAKRVESRAKRLKKPTQHEDKVEERRSEL